ncbi:hypothetical protein [Leptolyngbya sp. FACHB-711]|uniref:hypothetical protein n=1 Tax=unclassified Leptolyngbya TaxID=2650499 RepID=UPI001686CD47|nr:hypothetical protein [Leptolyngbya sp. FACHB-711]MBD1849559.1 hypothetical protein [Cyanobacteria bacterium FACHB-502]MBD2026909.1 hypothetical protein [Leptolyngbya sp. FACHB-711]
MEPSNRIKIISEIARSLDSEEYSLIDLILRQFGLPWADQWNGDKTSYVIEMIEGGDDQTLLSLASHLGINSVNNPGVTKFTRAEIKDLLQNINQQKAVMINVATGGSRIQEVNEEYKERRISVMSKLQTMGLQDPNPFSDLWSWYNKWSDGSLPTYGSRREYISNLYQQLVDNLIVLLQQVESQQLLEPTGWARVDRNIDKIVRALANAHNEEDYQAAGLLCRETIISLAQAVYDPEKYSSLDGVAPSETDAKRMLESYIAVELAGGSKEALRKYVKDAYQLAVTLQHKRNATFREAALCVEATRSLVNSIAIISGQREL